MAKPKNRLSFKAIIFTAIFFCWAVICIALSSLAWWIFDFQFLNKLGLTIIRTNYLSAILFLAAGYALWLIRDDDYSLKKGRISQSIAFFLVVIGLGKIISLIIGFDFWIDHILFSNKVEEVAFHDLMQMSPNSAFNFILLGIAIILIDSVSIKKQRSPAEYFCIMMTLISLLNLYGYVYGVRPLYGISSYSPMPLSSVFCFLFLAICILFLRPHRGSMAMIIGENPLEVFYLRFLALFLPLLFGWFKLWGEDNGLFSKEFGTAIIAVLTYAMAMFLLGRQSIVQHRFRKIRENASRIIKEDANRLKAILDNSATLIFITDTSARFLIANKHFQNVYEIKEEAARGKHISEIFSEENTSILLQEDTEIFESEKSKVREDTIKLGDKSLHFITVRFPLIDSEGKIYAICSISTDVSKLKEYERELIEKEKLLSTIIDNIGEGIVVADSNGKILVFNQNAEEIVGMNPLKSPPEKWSEKFHILYPDGKTLYPSEKLPLAKALKGESSDDVELFINNPNISEGRRISVSARPFKLASGINAGVSVFRDVTQRRKLQDSIRENEERLRAILSSIGEGIVVSDTTGKMLLFNKKAEEILGRKAVNTNPSEWSEIYQVFHLDGKTLYEWNKLPLALAIQGESVDNLELLIKSSEHPEGRIITFSGRPIKDEQGNVTAGVVDFRDITEFRYLERLIREIEINYKDILDLARAKSSGKSSYNED